MGLDSIRVEPAWMIPNSLGITLADQHFTANDSRFYDDNYDGSSPATALATLTNSFAHLIDPFDPDNSSALGLYDVCTLKDPILK